MHTIAIDDPFVKKFAQIWTLLRSESVRGSVIVAAAINDDILRQMLSVRLLKCNEKQDNLLEGANAPIGNMAARIDLCHRTACISSNTRNSLHLLRKLRNDFAHLSKPISFDDQSVCSRTERLLKLNRQLVEIIWPNARPELFHGAGISDPPKMEEDALDDMLKYAGHRHTFEIWASVVAASLSKKCEEIEAIEESKP